MVGWDKEDRVHGTVIGGWDGLHSEDVRWGCYVPGWGYVEGGWETGAGESWCSTAVVTDAMSLWTDELMGNKWGKERKQKQSVGFIHRQIGHTLLPISEHHSVNAFSKAPG